MMREVAALRGVRPLEDELCREPLVPGSILRQRFPGAHRHHGRWQRSGVDDILTAQPQRHTHAREDFKMRAPLLGFFLIKIFSDDEFSHFYDGAIADNKRPTLAALTGKARPLLNQNPRSLLCQSILRVTNPK